MRTPEVRPLKICGYCEQPYPKKPATSWKVYEDSKTCSRTCGALIRRKDETKKAKRRVEHTPGQNNYGEGLKPQVRERRR